MISIFNRYWGVIPIIFVVLFFGKIASNAVDYGEYKDKFKIKCEQNGGVMFIPKGVKGWPVPECRNPDSVISIEVSHD